MATTQLQRDQTYKAKQLKLGFGKICVMFPVEYRKDLEHYAARKRKQWEKERNAL